MKKSVSRTRSFAAGAFAVTAIAIGCGENTSPVDGNCRYPYIECDLTCIDPSTDALHCGACGVVCPTGVACIDGVCGGKRDGAIDGAGDAFADGPLTDGRDDGPVGDGANDGSGDGSSNDGSGNDGGSNDGSSSDGTTSDGSPVDGCTPPYVTNAHCGSCFNACTGANDTCKVQNGGVYACAPFCSPPLTRCGNECKNLDSDGDNCGVCGRVCASNICINGICQGAASGDIVYIGHDYAATPPNTAQARLLENSVLLSPKTPIRVLVYQRYAAAAAITRVNTILATAQARTGRTIQVTPTSTDAAVTAATTTNYEVVLVHDQVSAPSGALTTLGTSWSGSLASFTHVGGVFIALDGATGTGQMPGLVTQTGLLDVASHQPVVAGEVLELIAPTDAIAIGVVSPFAMRVNTSRFTTEANGGRLSWVVRHVASGEPNVVHKIAP